MKKVITILMIMTLLMSLSLVVSANEMEQGNNDELKAYIEEKVVPVIIGVATSIVALLGTLKSIFAAIKELKKGKEDFVKTSAQIKQATESDSRQLRADYNAIKDSVKDVPELLKVIEKQDTKIEELKCALVVTTEILSLAYSANSELVRTGKAKEMSRLLGKLKAEGVNNSETI